MGVKQNLEDTAVKKYVLWFLGLFLLIVDIRIDIINYPAFVAFRTEAPNTVDMVIRHVIGDEMVIDVMSDAVGFILMFAAMFMFISHVANSNDIAPIKSGKLIKSMSRARDWAVAGFFLYIAERIMPFFLNGNYRFRLGYVLYFAILVAEVMVFTNGALGVCKLLDNLSNHTYNNLSTIFMMISIGSFTVARVLYFYELTIVFIIYYVLSFLFFMVACYRLS